MTYLSSISLNPLRTGTQSLLRSPQKMHAAVLGGLAVQPVEHRALWRLEKRAHKLELLVLTKTRPSWEHIIEQAGWPGADGGVARIADYEPLLALVMQGREFRFRVKANAVSSLRAPQKLTNAQAASLEGGEARRGFRVGHRTTSAQLAWFVRRASDDPSWGFTVGDPTEPNVQIVERERLAFRKPVGGNLVTLDTAVFEGRLRVTDSSRFRDVVTNGLGKGKAYGCGLLTLAGLRE